MSITCTNDRTLTQQLSGTEISPSRIEELSDFLRGFSHPYACYLEVYRSDEILIAPVGSDETSVATTGLENGRIQVDVTAGQARLRSMETPKGIIANQGDRYIFDGEGSISPGRRSFEPLPQPLRFPGEIKIPPIRIRPSSPPSESPSQPPGSSGTIRQIPPLRIPIYIPGGSNPQSPIVK